MRTVSVSNLKAHLSRYLGEVRRGGEIQVSERGVPIARITKLEPSIGRDQARRDRLIRAGILRAGTGDARSILKLPPLKLKTSLRKALDADRGDRF